VLSVEKFRARIGLTAVAALALAGAAAVLLVLLDGRDARIVVVAVGWLLALALTVWLARRARERERARREELASAEARHNALLDGLPLVTWLRAFGDPAQTLYVAPAIADLTGYSAAEWRGQPEL
jgi:PAS domain-containing protein